MYLVARVIILSNISVKSLTYTFNLAVYLLSIFSSQCASITLSLFKSTLGQSLECILTP